MLQKGRRYGRSNTKDKEKKEVNNNRSKKFHGGVAARIIRGSLAILAVLAISGAVYAQEKAHEDDGEQINFSLIPPVTPTAITPPEGSHLFLVGHAFGSQGYVCLPKDGSVSWTVNGARPEATLFATFFGEPIQIITHFLSHNDDPKAPQPVAFGNATCRALSTAAKCGQVQPRDNHCRRHGRELPEYGLDCLPVADSNRNGRRANGRQNPVQNHLYPTPEDEGGSAPANPATGCLTTSDVGHQVLVPYTADYLFYRGASK